MISKNLAMNIDEIKWCIEHLDASPLHNPEMTDGKYEFRNKSLVHLNVIKRTKMCLERYRDTILSSSTKDEGERESRADELLRLILPMAKGYAYKNNVGNNQAYIDAVEQYLIVNEGKPKQVKECPECRGYGQVVDY